MAAIYNECCVWYFFFLVSMLSHNSIHPLHNVVYAKWSPTYSRGWMGRFNTKVIFLGMMFLITNKRYDVRPSEFYNGTSTIPPTHRKYTRCSVDTKTLVCHILFNKSRMWCWWMRETIYPALVSIIFIFNFPSYWRNVWAFWRLNICYYWLRHTTP